MWSVISMEIQGVLIAVLLCCVCWVGAERQCNGIQGNITGLPADTCSFDLRMKGAAPNRPDQYLCAGYDVKKDILNGADLVEELTAYIVRYEPLADAGTAHHILVFGCEVPHKTEGIWSCGEVCSSGEQIIFAWAKNAPPLSMPKDVGYKIGADTSIKHIVIQVHYSRELSTPDNSGIRLYTTLERQQARSGIFLLVGYGNQIPPQTKGFTMESSCKFSWPGSIHPFGFRTHAHGLGTVISGYKVHNNEYEMIGKGNPQWPQAFYPVQKPVTIESGDYLVARCVFDSTGRDRFTKIGSTSNDEMCNFYIMYYRNATDDDSDSLVGTCAGDQVPFISMDLPPESSEPLPPNPELEAVAMGDHHHKDEKPLKGDGDSTTNGLPVAATLNHDLDLKFVSSLGNLEIGQVGGVATSKSGDVYVFHRGSIVWNSLSFDGYNNYQFQTDPVSVNAILVLSPDGQLKQQFGKNMFFMPHGLTVDSKDNVWLTDVALHQVFRIPAGKDKPDMTLGIRFEPGTDNDHFCKPSDIAVLENGEFFVSDGYCNNRIMHFDANGYFKKQWGSAERTTMPDGFPAPGAFNLPHGLTLAEEKNLLCVADRQNGRIQCFDLAGNFVRQMHPPEFGQTLYALEYCPNHGGVLFAVNGPANDKYDPVTQGFTLDINTGKLLSMWNVPGDGLNHPHDVTVDTQRHLVYVGELNPQKVWKFEMTSLLIAENKTSIIATTGVSKQPVTGGPVVNRKHPFGSETVAKQQDPTGPSITSIDDDTVVAHVDTTFDNSKDVNKELNHANHFDVIKQDVKLDDFNVNKAPDIENIPLKLIPAISDEKSLVSKGKATSSSDEHSRFNTDSSSGATDKDVNRTLELDSKTLSIPNSNVDSSVEEDLDKMPYLGKVLGKANLYQISDSNVNFESSKKEHKEYTKPLVTGDSLLINTGEKKKNRLVNVPHLEDMNEYNFEKNAKTELESDTEIVIEDSVNMVDVVRGTSSERKSSIGQPVISDAEGAEDLSPSIIIGTLLIVPVLLLVVVTIVIRLYQTGNFWRCQRRGSKRGNKKFNLGSLLNPHKGFDRLSTEDDDHDLENMMDDSDNEEFSIVRKA